MATMNKALIALALGHALAKKGEQFAMTARPQVELPGSDIDVMRDVYMTGTQRKAFDSILARLAEFEARAEGLADALRSIAEDCRRGADQRGMTPAGVQDIARRCDAAIAKEAEREAGSA